MVAQGANPAPWKANAPAAEGQELSLELPTEDVQKSIELVALPRGRGKVIVVGLVEPDSAAAAAGVAAGQQLLAISDPIRAGDMWELDGKSALKYVQQAIRGRGLESTTVRVTTQPAPEYERLIADMEQGEGAAADADPDGAAFRLERQYQLQRLQEAAAMQERARQEARLAKRQEAIQAGRAKLAQDYDSPPAMGGAGLGLAMLLPLTILGAALGSGYIK